MPHWNSLTDEENERVKAALQELRHQHNSAVELAATLKMPGDHPVSQQVVSAVLAGIKPAGVSLARAVAARLGITFDELVTGRRLTRTGQLDVERNDNLPGWADAAREVLEKRQARRYAVVEAGKAPVTVRPEKVTPEFVYDLALLVMRHLPLPQRIALENAELEELLAQRAAEQVEQEGPVLRSGTRLRGDAQSDVHIVPVGRARGRG